MLDHATVAATVQAATHTTHSLLAGTGHPEAVHLLHALRKAIEVVLLIVFVIGLVLGFLVGHAVGRRRR